MQPLGQAIRDYFEGDAEASIVMHSDDGETMVVPARIYFREPSEWSHLERAAVDNCSGRVLDVGAGAGCHSLVLQERGLSVCAIDISPDAVYVMKKRGLSEVHLADVFGFQSEPFDTLLLMMNGIGIVETLDGLDAFLESVKRLVKPEGQILLDSFDASRKSDFNESGLLYTPGEGAPYFGEVRLRLEYKGRMGPPFGWLYVDVKTLTMHARKAGWHYRIINQKEDGAYLARLSL